MSVVVPPTVFLEQALDPISKHIDAAGGPHILAGLIAAGGQPHVYLTGNVSGTLKAEIYEALADVMRSMAHEIRTGKPGIVLPGDVRL